MSQHANKRVRRLSVEIRIRKKLELFWGEQISQFRLDHAMFVLRYSGSSFVNPVHNLWPTIIGQLDSDLKQKIRKISTKRLFKNWSVARYNFVINKKYVKLAIISILNSYTFCVYEHRWVFVCLLLKLFSHWLLYWHKPLSFLIVSTGQPS